MKVRHDWRIPRATIEAIYARSGDNCEVDGCANRGGEMHHITYSDHPARKTDDGSIRGRERPEHLRLLCRACHKAQHLDVNGNFWRDS